KGTPGLSSAEVAQLAVSVSQAEGSLSGIYTGTEQFKFELCFQLSVFRRCRGLNSEATLPDAPIGLAVWCKLIFESRQLHGSYHIEPIRIGLLEMVISIKQGEAVHAESTFTVGVL